VLILLAIIIFVLLYIKYRFKNIEPKSGEVFLNFVNYEDGLSYRRGVPLSQPIKELAFELADLLKFPKSSTSLWLKTGQRLRWCYRVADYKLESFQDVYVVQRNCNNLCGCCSIEDICGLCCNPVDFGNIPVEPTSGGQTRRLISNLPDSSQTMEFSNVPPGSQLKGQRKRLMGNQSVSSQNMNISSVPVQPLFSGPKKRLIGNEAAFVQNMDFSNVLAEPQFIGQNVTLICEQPVRSHEVYYC